MVRGGPNWTFLPEDSAAFAKAAKKAGLKLSKKKRGFLMQGTRYRRRGVRRIIPSERILHPGPSEVRQTRDANRTDHGDPYPNPASLRQNPRYVFLPNTRSKLTGPGPAIQRYKKMKQ